MQQGWGSHNIKWKRGHREESQCPLLELGDSRKQDVLEDGTESHRLLTHTLSLSFLALLSAQAAPTSQWGYHK